MATPHQGSIASYFKPTGEVTSKSKAATIEPKTTTNTTTPMPPVKDQGKRRLSSPPPAPAAKRTNMTSSSTPPKHLAYHDLPTTWLQDASKGKDAKPSTIQLSHHKGDIFAAPPGTLLIHACNTQGHWGAGIAKAFKDRYPKAYAAHHTFCSKAHKPKTHAVPTGTAQILAPVDSGTEHWIGCVFTSAKYGRAKDKADVILRNTKASMEMLLELVRRVNEEGEGEGVRGIRMCKINSGKFGVPWAETEEVVRGIVAREGWMGEIEVWEPMDA